MKIKEGRIAIKKQIDKIEDEGLIAILQKLIDETFCMYYESTLIPMSKDELYKRIQLAQQDIAKKRTISLENLKDQSENW
jgi:hypothetical protein